MSGRRYTWNLRLGDETRRVRSAIKSVKGLADDPVERFRMSDEHRIEIKNSSILRALIEHVQGEREMSVTQVSAGLGLLKKVLPDLPPLKASGARRRGSARTRLTVDFH
jgi:hypothetical protein